MSSESLLVVVSVDSDVKFVLRGKPSHHLVNVLHSLGAISHRLSGEVGVTT